MTTTSADSVNSVHRLSSNDSQKAELLSDQDVRYIVERKLRGNNFNIVNSSMVSVDNTNGYLGQYYNIRVTVKLDDSSTKMLNFFAKTLPPTESPQYAFILRYDTFNKEIFIYTDVIRRMGVGKGFKWLAECYLCKRDSVIVLENAKLEGYVIHDKLVPFDESHCLWTIKALSNFHSRSLILEEKLRRTGRTILDLYGHLMEEVLFTKDELSRKIASASVDAIFVLIDLVDELNDREKETLKKRVNSWASVFPNLLKPSSKYRNVICHRDLWANNIMFKHDSNGSPLGCYLIDFQMVRYCPPAMDVVFSLYLITDRATRNRLFDSLLKVYHETLKQALVEEGLDVEECLSWLSFRDSCYEARNIAMFFTLMNLQLMLMPTEAAEDFMGSPDDFERVLYGDKRPDLIRSQYEKVEPYRNRIKENIIEVFETLSDRPSSI
ncbi:hypothetical protein HZH68_012528 [Vespula germanica]|uniref:CHK kinase-like domain-containing protein n=1 Tax=Vespula germanica TaxID=30212 RepID=A0A834JJ95_VESGE|nr:hypothetical protein HZH68_012528 [Vespula germanica]